MTLCPKHPKYQVKRRPTADCRVCMKLWVTKFPDRAREYQNARRRIIRAEARRDARIQSVASLQSYCDDLIREDTERIYSDGWYKN